MNIHSTNWLWINKAALDKAGGKVPTNIAELITLLDAFKGQGLTALAHGGVPWQDGTLWEAVVLSTGGPDFYKKAVLDLDPAALSGDTMKKVFDTMSKLRTYFDPNFSGREWNLSTALVIEGKAGAQEMGDWSKGEWLRANKKPGTDFVCIRFPGTQGSVLFNADQFMMFDVGKGQRDAHSRWPPLSRIRASRSPSTRSRVRFLPVPTSRTTSSTIAARREWRTSPRLLPRAR